MGNTDTKPLPPAQAQPINLVDERRKPTPAITKVSYHNVPSDVVRLTVELQSQGIRKNGSENTFGVVETINNFNHDLIKRVNFSQSAADMKIHQVQQQWNEDVNIVTGQQFNDIKKQWDNIRKQHLHDCKKHQLNDIKKHQLDDIKKHQLDDIKTQLDDIKKHQQDNIKKQLDDSKKHQLDDIKNQLDDINKQQLYDVKKTNLHDIKKQPLHDIKKHQLDDTKKHQLDDINKLQFDNVMKQRLDDVKKKKLEEALNDLGKQRCNGDANKHKCDEDFYNVRMFKTYNVNKMFKNCKLNDDNFTKVSKFECGDESGSADKFYLYDKSDRDVELVPVKEIKHENVVDDTPKLNWEDVEEWRCDEDQVSNSSNNLEQLTSSACDNSVGPLQTRISYNRTLLSSNLPIYSLICDLINFYNFQTDLATLSKRQGKNPNETISLLKDNSRIFSLVEVLPITRTIVKLRPKITFCSNHLSTNCQNDNCSAVHICPHYIYDSCDLKSCKHGHTLRTEWNIFVFQLFYVGSFEENLLKEILRKVWEGTIYPKICFSYHNGICANRNCMELHLCYKHVMSLGLCPGVHTYCPFNHDIYDPRCEKVLKYYNISTNETPRDLMRFIMYSEKHLISQPHD